MNTSRINASSRDGIVLIAIFFLQYMKKPTSNQNICNYYKGNILKPDAVKDALRRLKLGGIIQQLKGGRGTVPEYKIELSAINAYFSDTVPSESTRYREFRKLIKTSFVRYDTKSGDYVLNAKVILRYLKKCGVDMGEVLDSFRKAYSAYLKQPLPEVSVEKFEAQLDGQVFRFDQPILSLNDEVLQLCQKALSSPRTSPYAPKNTQSFLRRI